MGTSDRIERERQAKRTLILEAARALFAEQGYEAVTLREVAQRIEHSTTAVYVHFKDKRDLVEQMVQEDFAKFDAALQATAEVTPALARILALGKAYIDFALAMPKHYQLLFLTPRPMPEKQDPERGQHLLAGASGFALLLSTVQACIDEGAFAPEYQDALGIAQGMWASVHGMVALHIILGHEHLFQWRDPVLLHRMLMEAMLRGMAPGAAATGEAGGARTKAGTSKSPKKPKAAARAAPATSGSGRGRRTAR
jgi:AcrR family transcriptional regulator